MALPRAAGALMALLVPPAYMFAWAFLLIALYELPLDAFGDIILMTGPAIGLVLCPLLIHRRELDTGASDGAAKGAAALGTLVYIICIMFTLVFVGMAALTV